MAAQLPGQKVSEVELLKHQLAESRQRQAQVEQVVMQRATSTVGEFLDGLRAICNGAQQGNPQALQNLQELDAVLELARGLVKGVTPVRGIMVPPQNGRR